MTRAKLTSYDTYSDYILYLCQQKGITIKKMCEDLNFNYPAFRSNYRRNKLSRDHLYKLINYLNADFTLLMTLPLSSDLKKERKDNENG